MTFVLSFFRDGGPFMYLILMAALPTWGLIMVLALLRLTRKKIPDGVWFVGPAVFALVGFGGFAFGMSQALRAVTAAAIEHKGAMLASGAAVATYPDLFGLQIAALLAGTGCLATGLATFREGATAGISPVRLGVVLIAAVGGVLASLATAWTVFLAGAMILAAAGTGLAVARKPSDDDVVVAPGGAVTAGLGLVTVFCVALQGVGVARVQALKDRAVSGAMGAVDVSAATVELLQASTGAGIVVVVAGLLLVAAAVVRQGGAAPRSGVLLRGGGAVALVVLVALVRFAVMDGFVVEGLALSDPDTSAPAEPAPRGR